MHVDATFYELFRVIAYGIGLGPWFALAGSVAAVGLVAMAWRQARRAGTIVVAAGAGVAWVGLMAVSECQDVRRLTPEITARFYTYADAAREAAQLGLLALPLAAWGVKVLGDRVERQRRRSLQSTYLRIATKAYLVGNYDRAIAEYSIAIKVDPRRPETYVKRGLAWSLKGDYARAIADFERAMKIDPSLGTAYLNRGIVLAARGEHDAAIADFERADDLSPTDVAPKLHRGLSLAKLGDVDRAADAFRLVLRLTNHSDFVDPARFHLAMLEANGAGAR
jgi:tetratricopeptide (TPR) repeat protein